MTRRIIALVLCVSGLHGQFARIGGGSASAPPSDTAFITSVTGGTSMNNFTGYIGMKFTLSSTKTLTAIGRYCLSGNSLTHDLWIIHDDNSGSIDHQLVAMTGCTPGTFVYVSASGTLTSGSGYACISGELNGGDAWLDDSSTVTSTGGSVVISTGADTIPPATPVIDFDVTSGKDYVPCNFKYS